jgi:formylglycine-generating enzyme required for sulfatase activity
MIKMKKTTHYLCLLIGLLISLHSFGQHRGLFVPNGTTGTKPATSEKRIALIIANKDYQYWSDLATPISDADLIAGKLRNAGFQTEVIYNANRAQMVTAINALRDKVSGTETVALVYYAGHGIAHNGTNYLIPTDDNSKCGGDFRDNSISLDGVQDKLKYAGAAMNILLVDACRNVFTSPLTCPVEMRSGSEKGFVAYQPRGTFISFSTAPGTEALDKKPGTNNSPYAYALANALDNQGYQIEDVFKQVNRELAPEGQTPWVNNSYTGNFYFHYQKPTANEVKDSDNDGLLDNIDKCPYEKGPVTNYGCPEDRTSDPFASQMKYISSGTFQMGSNDGESDEKPTHSVTLSSFYMSQYEVTQKQWRDIMGTNPSYFKDCDNCPVEQVSWNEIQDFLQKLNTKTGKNYRLPTEAEWEYACRAGTTTTFNTGDNLTTAQANYDGNYPWKNYPKGEYRQKTTPVDSFSPNAWGLYDMHGNVWEWCSDWYGSYSSGAVTNPKGPSTGTNRVLRGGSWDYYAVSCRSADRLSDTPDDRSNSYGFRIAL